MVDQFYRNWGGQDDKNLNLIIEKCFIFKIKCLDYSLLIFYYFMYEYRFNDYNYYFKIKDRY